MSDMTITVSLGFRKAAELDVEGGSPKLLKPTKSRSNASGGAMHIARIV